MSMFPDSHRQQTKIFHGCAWNGVVQVGHPKRLFFKEKAKTTSFDPVSRTEPEGSRKMTVRVFELLASLGRN